jgi:hypothetical protein
VNTRICKPMLALGLSFNFATAGATIIHDTPTTWVLDEVLEDNVVVDHSEAKLIVTTGGVVHGGETAVRVRAGELDVTGTGRVIAVPRQPPNSHLPPQAMWLGDFSGRTSTVRLQDRATVAGEIYSDLSSGWKDESASVRLYLQDQSMVNGSINYSGYLRIEDQAIVRGGIGNAVNGNIGIDMSGGLVTGSVRLGAGNVMSLNMDGGAILGGVSGIWGDLDLRMTGGTIDGGLWTGATVEGEISGGRIDDGILIASRYGSDLRITGGQFDTSLDNWLVQFASERGSVGMSGLLDIWGGQFGYAGAGRGFLIDNLMSFSIHGRDLVYSNGWLTGYLSDGSWFSNALTFGSNWQGTFTIHNVPEPETLALFLMGLVGMTLARRNTKMRA